MLEEQELYQRMSDHYNMHSQQRLYVNECIRQCELDYSTNVEWGKRHDCFVADYSQCVQLPQFGKEQPGESYFCSPILVHVFGVTNINTDTMNA